MTLIEARETLVRGAELARLADAMATMITSPEASLSDLLLGLEHPGFVAEQAAFELHARTGRPWPKPAEPITTNADDWRAWLFESRPEHAEAAWVDLQRHTEEIVEVLDEDTMVVAE